MSIPTDSLQLRISHSEECFDVDIYDYFYKDQTKPTFDIWVYHKCASCGEKFICEWCQDQVIPVKNKYAGYGITKEQITNLTITHGETITYKKKVLFFCPDGRYCKKEFEQELISYALECLL